MNIKKALLLILAFSVTLSGCNRKSNENLAAENNSETMRAIWISYYDYDFRDFTKNQVESKVEDMVDNISEARFNNIFLHVRANADAIYPSEFFPFSERLGKNPDYDLLKIFINKAHEKNIKIHAWINPYRITTQSDDITVLPETHIARKISDSVISYAGGLYFNPGSIVSQKLILDGVEEILVNYNIDGIHFDDYFYPVSDVEFDIGYYEAYRKSAEIPLEHGDWRVANISALISSVKSLVSKYGKVFGISPTAEIEGTYLQKNGYANIHEWIKSDSYIDYVIPQIYWGFEYPDEQYRFDNLTKVWNDLLKGSSVNLYIGLAAYKIGTEDYSDEWIVNHDILARQVGLLKMLNINGYSVFSYSAFFGNESANTAERINYLDSI